MKIMILLHIICAIAAFGPALAFPLMLRSGIQASATQVTQLCKRLVTPGLIGLLVFGFAAAGMSEAPDKIEASELWISLSALVVIAALGIVWGLIIPAATKAVAKEGDAAERSMKRLAPSVGVLHLCMAIGLYLMVWQPS